MEVKIEPETDPVDFENPNEAKDFIEKKFRQFESNEQKRLKIELRK